MRKHFLILMLMALLPFTAWAADFKDATVVVQDITYGSTVDPVVVSATIGGFNLLANENPAGQVAKWNDGTEDHAIFYTSKACTTAVKVNVGTDDEAYALASQLDAEKTYYIKVVPSVNTDHTGFAAGGFFVHKATLHLTVKNAAGDADWSLTKTWDGLTVDEEIMDPTKYSLVATENLPDGLVLNPTTNPAETYIFDGSVLTMSYDATAANRKYNGSETGGEWLAAHKITFGGLVADNYEVEIAQADLNIVQKKLTKEDGSLDGVTITATGMTTTYNNEEQFPVYTVKVGNYTLSAEEVAANFDLSAYSDAARTTATHSINKGNYYVKLAAKAAVEGQDAIYSFTSYPATTGDETYATGTVYVRSIDEAEDGYYNIEVKTNTIEGWTGKKYSVLKTDVASGNRCQLYGNGNSFENHDAVNGVFVTINGLESPAVEASDEGNFYGEYCGTEAAADQANYQLTINRAVVFVKGKYTSAEYKGANYTPSGNTAPVLNGLEYTGLFAGTTIGNNVPTAQIKENIKNVGTTTITLTAPQAAYTNDNYTVVLDNSGIFEVTPKALTLAAKDKTAVTGVAPSFSSADVTINGSVNNTELNSIKGVVYAKFISDFTFAGKAAGVYPDVIEVTYTATADVLKNYDVTVSEELGDLTIGNGKIYITANPTEKVYGEDDPATFTYTVVGVDKNQLTTQPVFEREDADNENVGQYKIVLKTAAVGPANYDIEYTTAPVYFTITPAPLKITALPQVIDPSASAEAATALLDQTAVVFDVLVNGDEEDDIFYTLAAKNDGEINYGVEGTKVGAIEFTVPEFANLDERIAWAADPANAGKLNANYDITVVKGDLIVGNADEIPTIVLPSNANTLMGLLNYYDGKKVNAKVEVVRNRVVAGSNFKWTAKKWNTLVLPFYATVAQISRAFGYAIVNVIDPDNTTINAQGKLSVKFRLEMDGVEANNPFTLKTTDALDDILDENGYVTFNEVTIVAPKTAYPSVDAGMGSSLVGVYEKTALDKENPGMFLNSDQWYNISSTSSTKVDIEEFDAYVEKGANAARDFEFTFEELDGSTTSISSVSTDNMKSNAAEGWYTVNGIKLQGVPTEKGVYINNGKKVVIK